MVRNVVDHGTVRSGGVLGGTNNEMIRNILSTMIIRQKSVDTNNRKYFSRYLSGKIALKVIIIFLVDIFQVFKTQSLQAINCLID